MHYPIHQGDIEIDVVPRALAQKPLVSQDLVTFLKKLPVETREMGSIRYLQIKRGFHWGRG